MIQIKILYCIIFRPKDLKALHNTQAHNKNKVSKFNKAWQKSTDLYYHHYGRIFTWGQLWPWVLSLPASLCLCQSWPCLLITCDLFKLGAQNLEQRYKTPWFRRQLTLTFKVKFYPIMSLKFVHLITHHPLKQGSPNLDQRWKTTWLRFLLFWGMIP